MDSGRPGQPGVSAPSLVLERMDNWESDSGNGDVFLQSLEVKNVILLALRRVRFATLNSVQWMVIGATMDPGPAVAKHVEVRM